MRVITYPIQVHPDDELAMKRHNSFGKTEMWYVVKAAMARPFIPFFSQQISPDEYVRRVEDNTFMDVLQKYYVKEEMCFSFPRVVSMLLEPAVLLLKYNKPVTLPTAYTI